MTVPFLNPLLGSETVEQQDFPTARQCGSLATSDSMPQLGGLAPQVSIFAMQGFEDAWGGCRFWVYILGVLLCVLSMT
jgi:hypothetical protein